MDLFREELKMLENLKFNKETNKYICPHCGKEYTKNGIGSHIWRKHSEEGQKFDPNEGLKNGTRKAWNKDLTKETDERVRKGCETLRRRIENHELIYKGHPHTEETKKYLSECAKKRKLGGWNSSKRIEYNGVTLQSTYELEFAKDLDKNNISWIRPNFFLYKLNGEEHRYYPDFYIESLDVYVDPKNNFLINHVNKRLGISDKEKINLVESQNNIQIIILTKDELTYNDLLEKIKIKEPV